MVKACIQVMLSGIGRCVVWYVL